MQRKRPRGITILGVLGIFDGIFMPIVGLIFVAISSDRLSSMGPIFAGSPYSYAFGGFLVGEGLAFFIVSIGLLRGRKWAWKPTIVLLLIGIAFGCVTVVLSPNPSNITSLGLGAGIDVLIIYYFYRPHVKSYFGIDIPTTGL